MISAGSAPTIAFGTSGLRGPVAAFSASSVAAYVLAFLDHIDARPGDVVYIGCDLRASSPEISGHVISAVSYRGQNPVWCGVLPTPAVAAAALACGATAIVITGSHIPDDFNGIKLYRPDGELLKSDEAPIRELAERALENRATPQPVALPEQDASAGREYVGRFVTAFEANALSGLKLGVFEHSAAGRDLLAEVFSRLGADVVRFGRSDVFVAVDTEALDPNSVAACAEQIKAQGLDAVISTDGDGDRPLLIGADGKQVNGDVVCTLAARALGIRTVVTPLTSTSAIEMSGWFDRVLRTKIGSPYVVAAMHEDGGPSLAGFEANGGFLLGSELSLAKGTLPALPTRDAILPLVAVCAEMRRRSAALADLVSELPGRVMKAGRLKQIPSDKSGAFLKDVATSATLRASLAPELAAPKGTDLTDGVRFVLDDGSVMHFRASGNAPELRAYVETDSAALTDARLSALISRMADVLATWPDH